jgi:hypothetical protein
MSRELIALRAEVNHLRSLVGNRRRGSMIVRRAHVDALAIVQAHYLGHATGRVEMGRQGMSKRRWAWAVALLRFAGVVSTRRHDWRLGLAWVATEDKAVLLLRDAQGVTLRQLRLLRREV